MPPWGPPRARLWTSNSIGVARVGPGVAYSSGSPPLRTLFLAETRVSGARTRGLFFTFLFAGGGGGGMGGRTSNSIGVARVGVGI